jgi:hypothetical protein
VLESSTGLWGALATVARALHCRVGHVALTDIVYASFALVARLNICSGVVSALIAGNLQVCCATRLEAVAKGHYGCFIHLVPNFAAPQDWDVYPCVSLMLRTGHVRFARHLFAHLGVTAYHFARKCVEAHDAMALQIVIPAIRIPDDAIKNLITVTIIQNDIRCLRVLLDNGSRFTDHDVLVVALFSHLDILELMLEHGFDWIPALPGQAACAGKVRFLMRIFQAGCRMWVSAIDGEPAFIGVGEVQFDSFVPVGQQNPQSLPD